MSEKIKVAVVGASGGTGSSIMQALLSNSEAFEVTALARPASLDKKQFGDFAKDGALVKPIDLAEPSDAVQETLIGMDVVISCLTLLQLKEELNLVEAARAAGVGRYVPSFFGPCCPPRGVMLLREMKENILDRIKSLYLPYTVIDVGWWYQLSLPPLPSGKIETKFDYSTTEIVGTGDVEWALTDNRDIGRYVARIITDSRTLNKSVFAYGEIWTQNSVWNTLERLSGETVPRKYLREEELHRIISEGQSMGDRHSPGLDMMFKLGMPEYKNLLGVRGDNTPEHAKYLGYLDAKELYPDFKATPLETYIQEAIQNKMKPIYS